MNVTREIIQCQNNYHIQFHDSLLLIFIWENRYFYTVCQNSFISFPTQFFVQSAGLLSVWAKGLHKRWKNIKVYKSLKWPPLGILFCSILFLLKVYTNMWMFSGNWMTRVGEKIIHRILRSKALTTVPPCSTTPAQH